MKDFHWIRQPMSVSAHLKVSDVWQNMLKKIVGVAQTPNKDLMIHSYPHVVKISQKI